MQREPEQVLALVEQNAEHREHERMKTATTQTSDPSPSALRSHIFRLRQRLTSKKCTWSTSPWPRAQRLRCIHNARSDSGYLHAHERPRLVRRLPAVEQQLPGQVDVLGGHTPVVASDGEHAVSAEQRQDACDDADASGQATGCGGSDR